MNSETQDLAGEAFDRAVIYYNNKLAALENPILQRRKTLNYVLQGMISVFPFVGIPTARHIEIPSRRENLTCEQQWQIVFASDLQRAIKRLDDIISGKNPSSKISVDEARMGKECISRMYHACRDRYCATSQ